MSGRKKLRRPASIAASDQAQAARTALLAEAESHSQVVRLRSLEEADSPLNEVARRHYHLINTGQIDPRTCQHLRGRTDPVFWCPWRLERLDCASCFGTSVSEGMLIPYSIRTPCHCCYPCDCCGVTPVSELAIMQMPPQVAEDREGTYALGPLSIVALFCTGCLSEIDRALASRQAAADGAA